MKKTIKAVLFDLDGTLLNTLPDLKEILNHTMTECGYPEKTSEEVTWCVGFGPVYMIRHALPEGLELTDEEFDAIYQVYRRNYLKYQNTLTESFPGIRELLEALKARGIASAIVTNKMEEATKRVVSRYFDGLITESVGCQDGLKLKPHPDMVNLCMERLGVTKDECIYVGDSDTDIDTGANAGMETLSVTWGFRKEDFLIAHGAKHLIRTPEEILYYVTEEK